MAWQFKRPRTMARAARRRGPGRGPSSLAAQSCHFELHVQQIDQRGDRGSPGVDDEARYLAIQRIALPKKIPQLAQCVAPLQQRSLGIVPQAAGQILWRRTQIDHLIADLRHRLAVGLAQHGAPSRGQNQALRLGQALDHPLLDLAETLFAVLIEVGPDRTTDLVLDLGVRINKSPAQMPRQLAPGGGFPTAGHTDQHDGHWVQAAPLGAVVEVVMSNVYVVTNPSGDVVLIEIEPEAASLNW